nr:MAG TPA: Protein of unknown function (DUF2612) [Caudoviricetes sp.]
MTHTERMISHLIGQFQDKPVIEAELEALGAELDALRSAFDDLRNKRWIDTGEGVQLDGIGTIVNRDRTIHDSLQLEFFGFSGQDNSQTFGIGRFRGINENWLASTRLEDDDYRKILWLKVFYDSSQATGDELIHCLRVLFNAQNIILHEVGNAKIIVGIGRRLTANDIRLARTMHLITLGGGIGLRDVEMFDGNYFGFLGEPNALGFEQGIFANTINI